MIQGYYVESATDRNDRSLPPFRWPAPNGLVWIDIEIAPSIAFRTLVRAGERACEARDASECVVLAICGKPYIPGSQPPSAALLLDRFLEGGTRLDEQLAAIYGPWSIVIIDARPNPPTILVLNDSLGLYPNWYGCRRDGCAAASMPEWLVYSGFTAPLANADAFAQMIVIGATLQNTSLLEGIRGLPPGSALDLQRGSSRVRRWSERIYGVLPQPNFDEAVDQLYERLRRAVTHSTPPSDGRIQLKLSGGFDSRFILACLLEEGIPFVARTYFRTDRPDEDLQLARALAARYRFDHEELPDEDHWNRMTTEEFVQRTLVEPRATRLEITGHWGGLLTGRFHADLLSTTWIDNWKSLFVPQFFARIGEDPFVTLRRDLAGRDDGLPPSPIGANFRAGTAACFLSVVAPSINRPANQFLLNRVVPLLDNDVVDLVLSLPIQYLHKHRLYEQIFLRHLPKYCEIPLLHKKIKEGRIDRHFTAPSLRPEERDRDEDSAFLEWAMQALARYDNEAVRIFPQNLAPSAAATIARAISYLWVWGERVGCEWLSDQWTMNR